MKKIILALLLALPMSMFAQKIGHVNSASIIQGMSEYTALQTEIQNLQKQFQDELQRKQTDIQTKSETYEKEKGTLSETLRTYREQEIQKAIQEYQQCGETSEQELQKVYQDKMGAIQEKGAGSGHCRWFRLCARRSQRALHRCLRHRYHRPGESQARR